MDKPRRRWLRFGIGTLLFLMLCVGGFLGGYRSGYDVGLNAGADAKIYAVSYQVGDLVLPLDAQGKITGGEADFDSLKELVVTTVDPETWVDVGGPGSIRPLETNLSLVVSQTQRTHESIATLFGQLRKNQRRRAQLAQRALQPWPTGSPRAPARAPH